MYEPPHKKRDKVKIHMSWFEIFKWNPKAVGHDIEHNVNDISLKEVPS